MIFNLYAVQDTMVGFGAPYLKVNEEVAKRDYQNFLKVEPARADMRLFKIGTYDDSTGTILPIIPECIMGGSNEKQSVSTTQSENKSGKRITQ